MRARLLIPALALLAACSDPSARTQAQPAPGLAQPSRAPPASSTVLKTSYSPVVKRAAPAVVNVSSRRVVRQRVDPFWDMFMGGGGVPRERVAQSLGSGAIVRADGVILTNNHVIEGADEIMVQLADRREFPARVLLADPRSDLAVLKIDAGAERLPVIAIDDQETMEVGDLVLAIGNPFGVGQTVTTGIISATARSNTGITDYGFFLQTDAAINPGNSGGPLVDMDGDLIGVNTAILSRSGTSSGVGFAIPAAMARQVVNTALGGGHSVVRPWLGVRAQTVTGDMARSLGMSAPRGAIVADVWPNGPAARAGVQQGDVIVAVGGQPVADEGAAAYHFASRRTGETVPVVVLRDGAERTLTVRAEAPPAAPARDERVISGGNPLEGLTVANMSPALADELGADPFAGRGVVVLRVQAGFAQQAGFRPGDLVREVNGREVRSTADLAAAVAARVRVWRVTIERNGQTISAQFRT
ncbi:MAG: Do family serine endopeptidase [Caulobacter sp.]|nr:Do family serine endopeptidase [Caulobacter sp.]